MRFHFGDLPPDYRLAARGGDASLTEADGWRTVRAPRATVGYALAAALGVLLMTTLVGGLILAALVRPVAREPADAADPLTPWAALILSLLLFIPLHEVLHLVCHPGAGRSPNSLIVVWPARLRVGVYYEGCMSRRRWSIMRAAPFLTLSLMPALILALTQGMPIGPGLSVVLQLFVVLNALGSGADALALILVLGQVPARSQLCFRRGSVFWRGTPVAPGSGSASFLI